MTNATKHSEMYQPPMGFPCWHTVADAAKAMGISAAAIRQAVRRDTDVRRISGRVTAGMVELRSDSCSRVGYLPYAD